MRAALAGLGILGLLTGCAQIEVLRPDLEAKPVPSRVDEIAFINSLRAAYTIYPSEADGAIPDWHMCYTGSDLKRFNPVLAQGYNDHGSDHETLPVMRPNDKGGPCVYFRKPGSTPEAINSAISNYLNAGFGLTDVYCDRFFIVALEAAQKRRFERDTGTTVAALVQSVLGFANAGKVATGITASGFTAIDSTYKNIDTAFLVAPDMPNVRSLVMSAQTELRAQVFGGALPQTYAGARSIIERYAGLCTFSGMKHLVDVSVQSQSADLKAAAETEKQQSGATQGLVESKTPGTRPPAAESVPASDPPRKF